MESSKLYRKGYASKLIRGEDTQRPWVLDDKIKALLSPDSVMLDIGSGDGRKLLNNAMHCKEITALEPSTEMRELAHSLISNHKITNINIVNGTSEKLPFQNNVFDIVSCMLAPWNASEVFRVLKHGGYFINEAIGSADKFEFKKVFGKDHNGNWRGSLLQYTTHEFIKQYEDRLVPYFTNVSIQEGYWDTYYDIRGLIELCEHTSTIKDFNIINDNKFLEVIHKTFNSPKGIKITQNRLLIIAKKP